MNNNQEEKRKELAREFSMITFPIEMQVGENWRGYVDAYNKRIFDFLLAKLTQRKEEIVKIIEGMRKFNVLTEETRVEKSYNSALDDLLAKLKEK